MEAFTPGHLVLILLGFMLLFGYKKLPDATRSLGRSLRIFKSEMNELRTSGVAADPGGGEPSTPADGPLATAAALEAEALQAEAEAAELRSRAEAAQRAALA